MLEWNIAPMLAAKGIEKPYAWLIKNKVTHNIAHRILTNKAHRVNLEVVAAICNAAWCTPNDVLKWVADPNALMDERHPLNALKEKTILHLGDTIKKLTPEQVLELAKYAEGLGKE